MNYTKPEVAVLGEAVNVIEQNLQNKTIHVVPDGFKLLASPAYDLDE